MAYKKASEQEDSYFHKQETAKLERARRERLLVELRRKLGEKLGLTDEAVLKSIQEMGFDLDTVVVLHLVPLVEVAWSDGTVSDEERRKILEVAAARDIVQGTPGWAWLERALTVKPEPRFFDGVRKFVGVILANLPEDRRQAVQNDLVRYSQEVAAASGGFLGLGEKVSGKEKEALERLSRELARAHAHGAKKVTGG
jgi:hypothetical protein